MHGRSWKTFLKHLILDEVMNRTLEAHLKKFPNEGAGIAYLEDCFASFMKGDGKGIESRRKNKW